MNIESFPGPTSIIVTPKYLKVNHLQPSYLDLYANYRWSRQSCSLTILITNHFY